jgi:hypothetical protein
MVGTNKHVCNSSVISLNLSPLNTICWQSAKTMVEAKMLYLFICMNRDVKVHKTNLFLAQFSIRFDIETKRFHLFIVVCEQKKNKTHLVQKYFRY